MNQPRSPFYIVEEFISPLACEEIIDILDFTVPDKNKEGDYISSTRTNDTAQAIIYERIQMILPEVMAYYRFIYKGTHPIEFEWYPEGTTRDSHAENANFVKGKWMRTASKDFTGILFLCDYQDKVPFEKDYEVYGGKLEFPQHAFGFNPIRGTLVLFPSDPHFINATATTMVGDLYQARIHMAAKSPFVYHPADFPGNYLSWFSSLLNKK